MQLSYSCVWNVGNDICSYLRRQSAVRWSSPVTHGVQPSELQVSGGMDAGVGVYCSRAPSKEPLNTSGTRRAITTMAILG